MKIYSSDEKVAISRRVKETLAKKRLKGEKIGRPSIFVDAAKVLDRIQNGEKLVDLCEELRIKKSALYRKLKDYRITALQ